MEPGFLCSSHSLLEPSCLIKTLVLCTVHTHHWNLHVWSGQWFYVQFTLIAGTFMSDQGSGFMNSSHSSLEPSCLIRAVVLCTVHTHRWNLRVWSGQWFYVQFTLIAGTFVSDQGSGFMYSSHSSLKPSCLIRAVVLCTVHTHCWTLHAWSERHVCVHDTGWQMCDGSCMGLFQWCIAGLPWRWTQTWVGGAGHEVWVPQHPADLRPWHLPSYVGPAHAHLVSSCLVPAVCLTGTSPLRLNFQCSWSSLKEFDLQRNKQSEWQYHQIYIDFIGLLWYRFYKVTFWDTITNVYFMSSLLHGALFSCFILMSPKCLWCHR